MWKHISNWRRKARYKRQQLQVKKCELYLVDEFVLVLPVIGMKTTFPDEAVLKGLCANIKDAQAIGDRVAAALEYGPRKIPAIPQDLAASQGRFLDGMERYRQSIGVGKRRFERDMEHLSIRQQDGEISLQKSNRAHGRFAFEGTHLAEGKATLPATASNSEIGAEIAKLMGCASR